MRPFLELASLALLILVGWSRPFSDSVNQVLPVVEASNYEEREREAVRRSQPVPPATPRDNKWMWERNKLDSRQEGLKR